MVKLSPDIIIGCIVIGCLGIIYIVTQIFRSLFESPSELLTDKPIISNNFSSTWIFRLLLNFLGYATIFIPGYIIFKYIKKTKYLERSGSSFLANLIKVCFVTSEGEKVPESAASVQQQKTIFQEAKTLFSCFIGLQLTYLTWGILQEKIMTQEYTDSSGKKDHFTDSQFLVFVNRIFAFGVSWAYLLFKRECRSPAPLYKYVFCSFSNIMSSWCQYEALKFISFPTQVLAKASKIIPVMIMGKIVSRKKYEYYEYVTAVLISLGMTFFMLGSGGDRNHNNVTTFSGVLLLAAYIIFDSFTSNWQKALFNQFHMSSMQMMFGVNLFSCLFTAVSLAQQGGFIQSVQFMMNHYKFVCDCTLLSICSAIGQICIFYTILKFGAVVFVIIMTIRQGLAILLSCLIYKHTISSLGIVGIFIVFISIFLRMYCDQRLKAITGRRNLLANGPSKV